MSAWRVLPDHDLIGRAPRRRALSSIGMYCQAPAKGPLVQVSGREHQTGTPPHLSWRDRQNARMHMSWRKDGALLEAADFLADRRAAGVLPPFSFSSHGKISGDDRCT